MEDYEGSERGEGDVVCIYCPKKTLYTDTVGAHLISQAHVKAKGKLVVDQYDCKFQYTN
jgi:hypothetical protein